MRVLSIIPARPGKGITVDMFDKIVGKCVKKDVKCDDVLHYNVFE